MNQFAIDISKIIQSRLGIHVTADKIDHYLDTLRKKSNLLKKISPEKYIEYLKESSTFGNEEWKIIVDSLNISETYFLRDSGQFEILEQNILPAIIKEKQASRKIRIWSAGCSTGEEPYSLAITLAEIPELMMGWDISILATDINGDSIRQAIQGDYLEWSFRNVSNDKKDKYFTKKKNGYHINDSIKNKVQFIENNLFHSNYYNEFDLILCRNVFIYFDDHSKKMILEKFEKALLNHGYLLIGHSEAAHLISNAFKIIPMQKSMVYQKKDHSPIPTLNFSSKQGLSATIPTKPATTYTKIEKTFIDTKPILSIDHKETLYKARELADLGKVIEAEKLVQELLNINPSNYEALFLQGQIIEAAGNWNQAIDIYKKVIYLEPNFLESYLTLSNLYCLLHNIPESIKVRKAGLFCLEHDPRLRDVYIEKGYQIESLKAFFSEESSIWL